MAKTHGSNLYIVNNLKVINTDFENINIINEINIVDNYIRNYLFPIYCKDTKENINNFNQYRNSTHWRNLLNRYKLKKLNNLCFNCKKYHKHIIFIHKHLNTLGCEKLTDIVPFCSNCYLIIKNNHFKYLRKKGNKKIERFLLSPLSFHKNNNLNMKQLRNIKPSKRGKIISKILKDEFNGIGISSIWLNNQVKQICSYLNN